VTIDRLCQCEYASLGSRRSGGIGRRERLRRYVSGSVKLPLLSEQEFKATLAEPMQQLDKETEPPFVFWPYFDAIPAADFCDHDCSDGAVDVVYRNPTGRYEHVLVRSDDTNVFMVLVLDRSEGVVLGHRLLDLNKEYGLRT